MNPTKWSSPQGGITHFLLCYRVEILITTEQEKYLSLWQASYPVCPTDNKCSQ